jgi:hypothetical protein
MISRITDSPLQTYSNISKYVERRGSPRPNTARYFELDESIHFEDGFRPYVEPELNENEETGALFYDEENEVVTRHIIPISEERLRQNAISQAQSSQEEAINSKLRIEVLNQAQAITDDEEALANKALYPLWEDQPNNFLFEAGKKYQSFEGLELKLFKVIQQHNKVVGDASYIPINAEALFTKIEFGDGGIEIWSEPIGGDGKYPYLDPSTNLPYRVIHNGFIWENNFNPGEGFLNVWEPGADGITQWTLIGPV